MREKSPSHHSPPSATTGDRIPLAADVMAAKSLVPYGRPLFSVRDRVTWTFGTADPCFLYRTGCWGLCTVHCGASSTGRSRFLYGTGLRGHSVQVDPCFLYGTRAWACSQTGPGGKPPHKAFFALPPATGNGGQLTILFFMPNFEPLFISTVNDNRRTGPAGHP